MTYYPSDTQIGHFIGRETVYCKMNNNMVEGVACLVRCQAVPWAVKQSTNLAAQRSIQDACLDVSLLIHDVSLQISVTNCVPLRGYTIIIEKCYI